MVSRQLKTFLFLLFLPGCLSAQFESAFKADTYKRIYLIDSIYTTLLARKDFAVIYKGLDNLKSMSGSENEKQARFMWHLLNERTKTYTDSNSLEKKLDKIQKVIYTAKEKSYPILESYGLLYMAQLLRENGRRGASIGYLMKAYELSLGEEGQKVFMPQVIALRLSNVLYKIGDYEKAKDFAFKAYANESGKHIQILSFDMLSQIYLHSGNHDSSAFFINKGVEVFRKTDTAHKPFLGWNGIFLGYRGKILYKQQNYARAIPIFKEALSIVINADMYNNIVSFAFYLADCYQKTGNTAEAQALIPLLAKFINKNNDEENFLNYYKLLMSVDRTNLSFNKSEQILDSIIFWKENIDRRNDQNLLVRQEMDAAIKSFAEKEKQLYNNIQRQKLLRTIILSLFGVLVIAVIIFLYKKEKQFVKERMQANSTLMKADMELAAARTQLEEFTKTIIEKSRQIELLESSSQSSEKDVVIEQLKVNTILTDEDWVRFKQLFETVHTGYLSRLKLKYPQLTAGEVRFIVLLKLALSNKEMASTLGVGPSAIRAMKSRLLKKIQLPESENLEKLFAEI